MFRNILMSLMLFSMVVLIPNQSMADVKVNGYLNIEQGGGIIFPDGILNSSQGFAGPIGPTGPQGVKGDTGPQGPAGQVTLDAICNAIIAANKVLPSYCTTATLLSIAVTPANSAVAGGVTTQFSAFGTFSDTSSLDITTSVVWSSSDSSVATISNVGGSKGKAVSVAKGATKITATSGNISGSTSLSTLLISEFAIPTIGSGPYDITAGPDGSLWFTEMYTNKIGRITTREYSPNSLYPQATTPRSVFHLARTATSGLMKCTTTK